MQAIPDPVGDNIDRLVTLEVRSKGRTSGVIANLYQAIRQRQGASQSLTAARRLAEAVHPGDVVLIFTGAGIPPFLAKGETDGPPGAAALARILHMGLGAVPVLAAEERFLGPIEASLRAIGLLPQPLEEARRLRYTCSLAPLPLDTPPGSLGKELLERYHPSALIAIEKPAPNRAGVRHGAYGMARPGEFFARSEEAFVEATGRGILTIGIGDNGNEIGFGAVEEAVRRFQPYGDRCRCPCGQGIASAVPCDLVVVAGTSNWGAYGIEAALALLLGEPRLLHDAHMERRVVEWCSRAGAAEGATGMPLDWVDGTPLWLQGHLMDILGLLVQLAFTELKRDF